MSSNNSSDSEWEQYDESRFAPNSPELSEIPDIPDIPEIPDYVGPTIPSKMPDLSKLMGNIFGDQQEQEPPEIITSIPLQRATRYSAGYDLYSSELTPIKIEPGQTAAIPTGVRIIKMPKNIFGQLCTKSRHALNAKYTTQGTDYLVSDSSLTVLAGIIDADYTGEIKVLLHNLGRTAQTIGPNEAVGQIIFQQYYTAQGELVVHGEEFKHEGFGSSS
jgi:deoxyuridine 5'-triphosphate nucleotidohydrolase